MARLWESAVQQVSLRRRRGKEGERSRAALSLGENQNHFCESQNQTQAHPCPSEFSLWQGTTQADAPTRRRPNTKFAGKERPLFWFALGRREIVKTVRPSALRAQTKRLPSSMIMVLRLANNLFYRNTSFP